MSAARRGGSGWTTLAGLVCVLVLGAAIAPAGAHPVRQEADRAVERFVDEVVARHGFERESLHRLLAQARVLDDVLRAMSRPAEALPWPAYRSIFFTAQRIEGGVAFWEKYQPVLERAEQRFGVPASVLVAIIGVETFYGKHTGRTRVLDALVTLAFHFPRRAEFFRRELEQFLLLAREEGIDPTSVKGSYAGAMGVPQFISSSYREYAVDFSGEGRRDLLEDPVDAIGSVANYLVRHGWRAGEPVAARARVDGTGWRGLLERGLEPHTALEDMAARGVRSESPVAPGLPAALIELDGEAQAEHWVTFRNFYAITRYNHSKLYAMVVHQLAVAIDAARRGEDG